MAEDQSGRPGVKSRDFTGSIEGIDANHNGVRDDIEDYINRTYSDPDQRAALMQQAQATVLLLTVNKNNLEEVARVATLDSISAECEYKVFGSGNWRAPADEILAMHLNTEARFRAYAEFMAVGGYVIDGIEPGQNPCTWQKQGSLTA